MPKRIKAIAEPELLGWARRSAGLDLEEAARKASVKPEQMEDWEAGQKQPTINQLRSLARVYKRPLAVFFLPEPPRDFQPLRDFRRLPNVPERALSPGLRFEIRQAHGRRETALELYEFLGQPPPSFDLTASLRDDPEQVGQRIRALLEIGLDKQVQWRNTRVAFNNWRAAFETRGALVFQASGIETGEMRGFSVAERPLPAVVVNVRDAYAARTFSMFHELAHLMLNTGGLCDLEEHGADDSREQRTEVFCNRVAAAALMPREYLTREPLVQQNASMREWPDQDTQRLARRYSVSREALLRRLLTFGRVSAAYYRHKRRQFQQEYEAWCSKQRDGYRDWAREPITKAGRSFVLLVMTCYNQGRITLVDASHSLGVNAECVGKVEAELRLG